MGDHALLSPSSANRWLACPPSAKICAEAGDTTSEYAAEGTVAHGVAELALRRHFQRRLDTNIDPTADPLYAPAMAEHADTYVSYIADRCDALDVWGNYGVQISIEQRVTMSRYVPGCYGTCDCIVIGDGGMEIVDYKYGQGVKVSAKANAQLMLYALGAILHHESYDSTAPESVYLSIVQPRLDHIDTWETSRVEILNWAENTVKPIALLAAEGGGTFKPGEHCRWCAIRATCRARGEANLALAQHEFRNAAEFSVEELGAVLQQAQDLTSWVSDLESYAREQALAGTRYPGWKLVEGRSNRQYVDEAEVEIRLLAEGYAPNEITVKKLLGITAMEKLLGKRQCAELLSELVVKPAGKPTLVPETDKRPEINSAASAEEDFKEVPDNGNNS